MKTEYCIAHYNNVWPFHRPKITPFSVHCKFHNYKGAELYSWIWGLPGQLVRLLLDWEHPSFLVHLHTFLWKTTISTKKKKSPYRTTFEHIIAPKWRRPMPAATQTNWAISDVRSKVIRRGEAFHNQETPETAGNKVNVQESKQHTHTHTQTRPDFTVNFCRNSFRALLWFTTDLRQPVWWNLSHRLG